MTSAGRRRLRLAFRDGAALAAFASVGISGEIPAWALVLFGVGIALALLDLRVLARAPVVSGLAVAASGALLSARVAFGGMDLVVAACTFAALITLHRLLSPPQPRVDHQVLLTSLLMISGAAALSGELLFAVTLALFAACACVALALEVVERAVPAGADFQSGPLLRWAGLCVLLALAGSAAFFVVLPRLSWNVGARRISPGLGAVSGLAEGVRLGAGSGSIKTNPRVVARVQIAPDPKKPILHAYWIARTYGTWTGTEWREDRPAQPPAERVEIRQGSRRLIHQRVELLPAYGSRTAVALVDPVAFGNAAGVRDGLRLPRVRFSLLLDQEVRLAEAADAYTYHVYSADPAVDRPRIDLSDAEMTRYVALPPVDPRVERLAEDVLQGETEPLRAAQRLQAFLSARYRYTLELPDSPGDPLANFLFERREGHCEYFATALAVMLRTQGFPARVATGFFGGERVGDAYVLRAGDAHAWTQIWVPGRGFIDVDATPEAGRAAQTSAVAAWLVRQYELVEGWWRTSVVDYSLGDQFRLASRVASGFPSRSPSSAPLPRAAWIVAGVLALAAYSVWRLWVLRMGRAVPQEATRLRAQAEALLERWELPPFSGEGFEEHTARVVRARPELQPALAPLLQRYLQARFGGQPLARAERKALSDGLRSALAHAGRSARAA